MRTGVAFDRSNANKDIFILQAKRNRQRSLFLFCYTAGFLVRLTADRAARCDTRFLKHSLYKADYVYIIGLTRGSV